MLMYALVIVEIGVKSVDRTFTYFIPSDINEKVKRGSRVKVPFGKQMLEGFVLGILDDYEGEYEVKEISCVVDEEPILNEEMLWLGEEISKKTLCSKISAYQVMLPKALKASYKTDMRIGKDRYLLLGKSLDEVFDYVKSCRFLGQREILEKVIKDGEVKITSLTSSIRTLLKHGMLKIEERDRYSYSYEGYGSDCQVVLNDEQQNAVDRVNSAFGSDRVFLLFGVTGSGKTEVYMNIIMRVIEDGKDAIMLVPEISLTPQIVNRFVLRFGDDVAILHSGLSDKERYDEYRKIREGRVHIVVGARSAIFAPFKNLGVIIIDEEHTSVYKQDYNPRYHARDVAILRSNYHHCPVVLGSATPSLESMARASNRVYELLVLKHRAGSQAKLPRVEIVDMKDEVKERNFIISRLLDVKIRKRLENGEKVILLLNRRGYSSISTCSACGEVMKCPNCDISLTYHKTSGMLRCHYCGYAVLRYDRCPKCGYDGMKDYGMGTQMLEEYISSVYQARVVRMDTDTTSRKGAHERIIRDFGNGDYDILIGTQMIAKGLDFPLVTLVGVINADASLNIPDFRSSERTFQLLSQVAGRAGRASGNGEVVIQTFNPSHYSIVLASRHDYVSFYREEMKIRKMLRYSPYYFMILVTIRSKDYEESFREAKKVYEYLRNHLDKKTIVLGPAMANVFRVDNVYHQQCIIKYQYDLKIMDVLLDLDRLYKVNQRVSVSIDVEPNRL